MQLDITNGTSTPETATDAAPANTGPVKGTMVINGDTRDIITATVGGKTVCFTPLLGFTEKWDIDRVMPPEDAKGVGYMRAQAMASVRMIDNALVPWPTKDAELRVVAKRLGDQAADFVFKKYVEAQGEVEATAKN